MPLESPDRVNLHEDPVAHVVVGNIAKAPKSLYRDQVFYFISKETKREFDQNPQLWVSVSHAEMTSGNHGVL